MQKNMILLAVFDTTRYQTRYHRDHVTKGLSIKSIGFISNFI